MGGTKRKIPIAKIEKKDPRAVAFSKRSKGLYSKASELCLLSGENMAILATPVSSKSHVSFYAFGHSSADSVVSAFLANQPPPRPQEDLGLGLGRWWEDPSLSQSDDTDEIRSALDSMSIMLQKLKQRQVEAVENQGDRDDVMNKEVVVLQGPQQNHQTLNLREGFVHKSEEDDQIVVISENNNNGLLDQISDFEDKALVIHKDLQEVNLHFTDLDEDQILALNSDNNNNNSGLHGNLDGCNDQELDLDQIFDFGTKSEVSNQNPCSVYETVEDGTTVGIHRGLDEVDIHLSDLDKDQILALISDNNNNNNSLIGNFDGCNKEFDLDQIFDESEGLLEMDNQNLLLASEIYLLESI